MLLSEMGGQSRDTGINWKYAAMANFKVLFQHSSETLGKYTRGVSYIIMK
jgi:hypothetical protein